MTNDNDAAAFEQISQSEATGRAVGVLMCFIGLHMSTHKGRFPSPGELGKFANHCADEGSPFRPEIQDFFHGVLEAISATVDPRPNEPL